MNTSWKNEYVLGAYQKDLILPNILRLLEIKKGEVILDLACGQGFFANEFHKQGARVAGLDISKELIEIGKKSYPKIDLKVSPADKLAIPNSSVDKITIILSIQNIENAEGVFKECYRVLKPSGKLLLVLNHPAFRIPKASDWGWDSKNEVQYRRVDSYISESKNKIEMHPSAGSGQVPSTRSGQVPGHKPSEYTLSFHRPLQFYFKALNKNNLRVSRLEEWNSHKKSEPGPRAAAENRARKEIPLFLFIEAIK